MERSDFQDVRLLSIEGRNPLRVGILTWLALPCQCLVRDIEEIGLVPAQIDPAISLASIVTIRAVLVQHRLHNVCITEATHSPFRFDQFLRWSHARPAGEPSYWE